MVHPLDPVPGHPGVTYLDLVKQAVPSLAQGPGDHGAITGHLPAPPPRHLAGKTFEGDTPDPVTLGWMQDERIVSGGQKRIVILADLGPDPDRAQSQTLLLLFTDDAKPRLLDVADAGIDRDTEFDERTPKLPLGPGDDALVTVSEHGAADISYDGRLVLFARRDRLQLIARVFVINARGCGWRQEQSLTLSTRPDPGRRYAGVDLAVRHRMKRVAEEGCGDQGPAPATGLYEAGYRWDDGLGRFTTSSTALQRLEELNSAGF